MRNILLRPVFKARGFSSSHVFRSKKPRSLLPMNCASVRHHSSNPGDEPSAAKWTQHSLNGFSKSNIEEATKETTQNKSWVKAYIALGSNLGDRVDWIEKACKHMNSSPEIKLVKTSSLWETDPMYVVDQDKFINGVCEVSLRPEAVNLIPNTPIDFNNSRANRAS
jgi:hypothetical protein